MKQTNIYSQKAIAPGDQVTCRPDGKVRGATVLEVYEDGSILVECYSPRRTEFKISKGRYQLSTLWNDPNTRKKL